MGPREEPIQFSLHILLPLSSLTSQIHFRKKKGKGPVNYVYEPCPAGMQLAGRHNQISTNALLNYVLQSKSLRSTVDNSCSSGKMP